MKIWKFPLSIEARQKIRMPQDAVILSLQNQNSCPTVWAAVDPNKPLVDVQFVMVGTGWDVPIDLSMLFIGTVQIGGFVKAAVNDAEIRRCGR